MDIRAIISETLKIITAPFWLPFWAINKIETVKLFEIRGVPTYLSSSLIIFIGVLTFMVVLPHVMLGDWWVAATTAGAQIIVWTTLYGLVVVHEYGHALTAKYQGYGKEAKVTLYPFAGAAMIDGDWHENPKKEFWIVVNGPLTNVGMALLAWPIVVLFPGENTPWYNFFYFNVLLLAFNALPIFPMDGGRVVRCGLTSLFKGDWVRSTFWTAIWTTVSLVWLAPLVWITFSPVGSILISVMALMGWAEYFVLKHKRDSPVDREQQIRESFQQQAEEEEFPDDLEKQEAHIQKFLEIDGLIQELTAAIIHRHQPNAAQLSKEGVEESAEYAIKTIDKVFSYIKNMPEEDRQSWNKKFTIADGLHSIDGGAAREEVVQNFLDVIDNWDDTIVEFVPTLLLDKALIGSMSDCTIRGEFGLPSGKELPRPPTGKVWFVNDGKVILQDDPAEDSAKSFLALHGKQGEVNE